MNHLLAVVDSSVGHLPNWLEITALCLYILLEWVLPRTNWVKANSVLEGIGNMLKPVLGKVPLVKKAVNAMATKEEPKLENKEE